MGRLDHFLRQRSGARELGATHPCGEGKALSHDELGIVVPSIAVGSVFPLPLAGWRTRGPRFIMGSGPRAVIFDVDGVLVDSYHAHLESWVLMAREHGLHITEQEFATTFGQTSREAIARFWGPERSPAEREALDARKEAIYRDLIGARFPAMDGAVELIDALAAAGFLLAVGSSGPPENIALTLDRLGRSASFQARVTGRDVTRGKPDPQVFAIAAERLGIPAARCAVIEDAPVGIAAARAAGMASIALVGTAPAPALAAADLMVTSLHELTPPAVASLVDRQR